MKTTSRMRSIAAPVFCWLCAAAVGWPAPAVADDWTQFRGPDGQGHSAGPQAPVQWSESQNIAWRAEIAGLGWSSPVVSRGMVWITTAIEDEGSLRAIALDARNGELLRDVEVFHKPDLGRINAKNSHASPTPVIDGDQVYVHFGAQGTACLNRSGEVVWRTQLNYDQHHGPGGSPIVWRDLLILNCDGLDTQAVVALDKRTGREVWRSPRQGKNAYSTPLAVRWEAGEQIISSGGDGVFAYDPRTGAELWRCRYEGHSVIPRPVFADGLVHICSGYWNPTLYSIRIDGAGDVTDTHVASTFRRGVPFTPSPLLFDDMLLLVSDRGIATCIQAKTGREVWRHRLMGEYSASPIQVAGRIYLLNEEGTTTVLAAGPKYQELAVSDLEGRSLASPAVAEGAIYLRTDQAVYCIRDAQAAGPNVAQQQRSARQESGVRRVQALAPVGQRRVPATKR